MNRAQLANRIVIGLRRVVALSIPLAWLSSFFIGYGWGWHKLHWQVAASEHGWTSLAVTGIPMAALAVLLWPGMARARRLAWAVLSVLLVGEIFLRVRPPAPSDEVVLPTGEFAYTARLYQPHHYTLFEPRPNVHTPDGLIHNRYGFRDERPLVPDPTAIRLVFVGGSTVYGALTLDNRVLFTRQLEAQLNSTYRRQLGARHFEVVDAGMFNGTSAETLLRLIFAVSEVQPALVAIQLGASDTWPRVADDEYFGDFRQLRKRYSHGRIFDPQLSLADSVTRALIYRSALLERLLGQSIPGEPLLEMINHNNSSKIERLKTNPPIYYERNLRYMLAVIRTMGAEPMLVGDPIPVGRRPDGLYQRAVPEHNAVMARLAKTENTPFLDLATALPLTDDIRVMDKYLNPEGQRRQAEVLLQFLQQERVIDRLLARAPTATKLRARP